MGCCAGKSFSLSNGVKEKIEGMKKNLMKSLTINRRTIKRESSGTRPLDSEIPVSLLKDRKKSKEESEEICSALSSHFLFKTLDKVNLDLIAEQMLLLNLEYNKILFTQGDNGYYFYLIDTGAVEIIVNDISKGVLRKPECFGELALLYDSPRTATIKTLENSSFWVINREKFREAVKVVASSNSSQSEEFLKNLSFFNLIELERRSIFLGLSSYMEYSDSQTIVNEGDPGDMIFLIISGQVKCSIQKVTVRVLKFGNLFGELATIFKSNRTATVRAIGNVKLLAFGAERSLQYFEMGKEIFVNSLLMAMENNQVLKSLNEEQKMKLIDKIEIKKVMNGEEIIPQGTLIGQYIFIILKGTLIHGDDVFQRNDIIGISNILDENFEVCKFPAKLLSDGYIGVLTHKSLLEALGGNLISIIKRNEIMSVIKDIYLFKPLPKEKLEIICDKFKLETLKPNSVILEDKGKLNFLIIVKSGQICMINNGEVSKSFIKSGFFGESSLILEEIFPFMVKSIGNAEIWKLSKKDFSGLLDESIINQIKKRINLQKVEVELTNLNLIKVLGTGTYGNVYLVHHPISDKLYALKVFLRSTIIQLKVFELLQMEKKVMQELDHPLITKLVKTFKDESRFYLLIEYINGIDFFEYLFDKGLLPIQEARFYISCIILAVEHIHSRGIVYRDLKPENILIDNEGYPVLIDFGVSKLVQERTYTLIGTPHYMAPEIVQGAGYSFSCDCWSLGVLLYECLVGKVPFGHEENDLYSIYKDIISFQFKFPKKFMDSPVKGVIEGLLEVEPEKRLKISECKNHEWLHGVNWDYLIGKFSKPPFIPKNQEIETLSGKPFDEVIYVKFIQDYESCTLLEYDEDVQLNEDIFNDF